MDSLHLPPVQACRTSEQILAIHLGQGRIVDARFAP